MYVNMIKSIKMKEVEIDENRSNLCKTECRKKDSLSIEGQIKQCEVMLKSNSPLVYKDEGFSGKNTDRPALKQ